VIEQGGGIYPRVLSVGLTPTQPPLKKGEERFSVIQPIKLPLLLPLTGGGSVARPEGTSQTWVGVTPRHRAPPPSPFDSALRYPRMRAPGTSSNLPAQFPREPHGEVRSVSGASNHEAEGTRVSSTRCAQFSSPFGGVVGAQRRVRAFCCPTAIGPHGAITRHTPKSFGAPMLRKRR
jgi:hypothetical protein